MSLCDIIKISITLVRGAYTVALAIRDSKNLNAELKDIARDIATDLTIIGGLLDNLQHFAQRVSTKDENFLIRNIDSLRTIITDAQDVLERVQRDRNFFQRLFMKRDEYRQQLRNISRHLHNSCVIIEGALPVITKIDIPRREFPDFRKVFYNVPDKSLSFYDFSIIKNTNNSVLTTTFDKFNTTQSSCYIKQGNDQIFLSYQFRTWTILDPRPIVLVPRRERFALEWASKTGSNPTASNSPQHTHTNRQQLAAAANTIDGELELLEAFMSHDDICGMAVTRSFIYIATKFSITIVLLSKLEIIAQYGIEGSEPNSFKHISYIYIPPNDETNLYIVDRGQYAVHLYRIDDSGRRFEYVRQYVVIANVNQQCNLISCVIHNRNLYVSDDANNCLHIFPLNGERQSFYLTDNLITSFSPGPLCAHGKYLYVANCSAESPGILVFNEGCQLVDWFRNCSLQEILAFDIDSTINELYVLTTTITINENGEKKKRLSIVSMDPFIRT
jgi:hypothetical protein